MPVACLSDRLRRGLGLAGAALALALLPGVPAAAAKTVTLATVNWAPFYSGKLPDGGPLAQVTRQAFASQGYRAEITFTKWQRAKNLVKGGRKDMLLGAWITEDRKKRYAFTDVIAYTQDVVLVRKPVERRSYDSLTDLAQLRIAFGRGYDFGERVERVRDRLQLVPAPDTQTMVRQLAHERVDAMLETESVALTAIKASDAIAVADVATLRPPVRRGRLAHAVPHAHAESARLVEAFNTGLAKLRRSGRYRQLLPPERFALPTERDR